MPMAVSLQTTTIWDVFKNINCIWTSNGDKFSMSSSELTNVNGVKYKFYVNNESDFSDEKEIELTEIVTIHLHLILNILMYFVMVVK